MIYHRFYHAEYRDDTRRLTMLEHGAYHLLLDAYYSDERPLPGTREETYRLAGAFTPEERTAVDRVVATFFTIAEDGCYHNARADEEIAKAQTAQRVAKENGKKGGRPKTRDITRNETREESRKEPATTHPLNHSTVTTSSVNPREREELPEEARAAFDALAGDRPDALAGLLRGIAGGMHGTVYTWAQMGKALLEYHANESGKFSARHFKGYLERDARGPAPRVDGTSRQAHKDAMIEAGAAKILGVTHGER